MFHLKKVLSKKMQLNTSHPMLFVGDLVNSMFAANQEVSQPLLDLASQDPRFKKGHKRSGKGAGRGRGRRGGAQVGGAGLGFGNTGYAPGTSLAAAAATKGEAGYAPSGLGASFNKGGFESTVDGTNASVASKYGSAEPAEPTEPAPPLPPPPSLVPDYPPEAATQPPPPIPQPPLPVQSAAVANMGSVAQQASRPQQQQAPSTLLPHPPAASATAAAAAPMRQQAPPAQVQGSFSGFKGMYSNRFGTSFVSSGSTGGDQALKATIVAPKQQGQRPAVPAPIPVTERPLFNRPGGLGAAAYQASTHQVWPT